MQTIGHFFRRQLQCRFNIHRVLLSDIAKDRSCPDCGKEFSAIRVPPMPPVKPQGKPAENWGEDFCDQLKEKPTSAFPLADRRELVCKNPPLCPKCQTEQVQLVDWSFGFTALWKCRKCKQKFRFELVT